MGLGAVALVAALGLRSRRDADMRFVALRVLDRPQRWRLVVVAAGLAAYQVGYFVAVDRAGVTIAMLITDSSVRSRQCGTGHPAGPRPTVTALDLL